MAAHVHTFRGDLPGASRGPGAQVKKTKKHTFYGALLSGRVVFAVALWEAFYIENKRFDLDTLRVPNRSPTPISKSNDFRGQSDDIWGARGHHFRPMLGVSGARAGFKNTYVLAL